MLCTLYNLRKEYRNKKIYIWNVNRDSMKLFVAAAFRRINIQGFITLQEKYEGEIYMNRPVLLLKRMELDQESIILVSDEVPKNRISMLPDNKVVYWSEAIGIDEELKQKKVIVYGTGYGAEKMCRILDGAGIDVQLYCVTEKNDKETYKEKIIIDVKELKKYEEYAVVISVVMTQYKREILDVLSDFKGQVYVENIIIDELEETVMQHINLIQSIDFAISKKKKIYLYSKKNQMAELIENVLNMYDINFNGYVYDIEDKEQSIKSIYELAYEGVDDKLIIINEEFPEKLIKARENVELAGFSLEKENYTGIQWYTRAKEELLMELKYYRDSLVGYSIIYPQGKPGWKIYGEEKEDSINILILGGSTSAEVWHTQNWVSKLYYKLKKNNIKTTVYNGAHESNGVVEEILRLIRDGYVLKPQIVISLSGVNNLYYKCGNQFNVEAFINWFESGALDGKYCSGVCSDESLYSFWSRNVGLLKLISESYGARFFGFLQPINLTMDDMTLREKSFFELEAKIEGAREFAQSVCDDSNYKNLMRLFEHQDGMYFDMCHYTNKANEIIADIIYEAIMPTIKILKEGKA